MRMRKWWLTVLVATGVFGAACGSSTGDDTTSSSVPTTVPKSTTTAATTVTTTATTTSSTTTTVPSLAVEDLVDVSDALLHVTSEGSFVDPEGLDLNPTGAGVGFFIAKDGLAVTTGRAVIGAESLNVRVAGTTDIVPATLVAYDECANLALIDVDGEGFRYLNPAIDSTPAGLKVYVPEAGSSGEFAFREGIIANENASGTTSWATIGALVEHTAATSSTNAGAPVLTEDVRVVGVDHMATEVGGHFAIPLRYVQRLRDSGTQPGLGLNGIAVKNEQFNGTWAAAIVPNSPADLLGMQPGDVVMVIGDEEMAQRGTQREYCVTAADESIDSDSSIAIFRTSPPQNFVGTLNSGEAMTRKFKPSRDLAYHLPAKPDEAYEFVWIERDDGSLGMSVPTAWTDVGWGNWVRGPDDAREEIGDYLHGVVDWDLWHDGWSTPGIWMSSSATLADEYEGYSYLDRDGERAANSACTYDGRFRITETAPVPFVFDVWYDCGEDGSSFIEAVFETAPGEPLTKLQAILTSQRDIEAFGRATATPVFPGSG